MTKDELIAEIKAHAEGLLSIEEINAIVEQDIRKDPDLLSAFESGSLMIAAKVWKSIAQQAAAGSGPAQALAIGKLNSIKTRNKRYE